MTDRHLDRAFWEALWSKTLRDHADKVAQRPPDARLTALASNLLPGRALDAGCGHGADTLWLATQGWHVTAVDFSASALAHGQSMAAELGPDTAARITWVEHDLATFAIPPATYDLVVSLYVHIAGSPETMVQKLAHGVAPGGTLFMVGYRPLDPATDTTTVPVQQQVRAETATAALDPDRWDVTTTEHPTDRAGTPGLDTVIVARRMP